MAKGRDHGREAFKRTKAPGYQFTWFDFAWLQQWFECSPRRRPHFGKGVNRRWQIGDSTVGAITKSEARAKIKAKLDVPRLEPHTKVEFVGVKKENEP